MKSICFFSSYFENKNVPYYVKCYITELAHHFDKLVLISINKNLKIPDIQYLEINNIEYMPVENEGYDFGMWQKAFNNYPVSEYDRIALVNDSCVLFKKLDHVFNIINHSNWDYCGILDSMQISYHPQSYFIIINKKAILPVASYFSRNGLKTEFNDVINTYEVGITKYLLENNFKIGSVFNNDKCDKNLNPSYYGIKELIKQGFPFIKKKIIFGNYRNGEIRNLSSTGFDFRPNSYLRIIKVTNPENLIIDLSILKKDFSLYNNWLKLFFQAIYWRIYYKSKKIKSYIYRNYIK